MRTTFAQREMEGAGAAEGISEESEESLEKGVARGGCENSRETLRKM